MGRKKKEIIAEEVGNEVVAAPVVEEVEEDTTPKETAKKVKVVVSASFKTKTMEGDRIVHKYRGEGASLTEALENVVGSEEDLTDEYGKPFPRGININVVVAITKGDYRYERSLAPQVSRAILENKNVALAQKLYSV